MNINTLPSVAMFPALLVKQYWFAVAPGVASRPAPVSTGRTGDRLPSAYRPAGRYFTICRTSPPVVHPEGCHKPVKHYHSDEVDSCFAFGSRDLFAAHSLLGSCHSSVRQVWRLNCSLLFEFLRGLSCRPPELAARSPHRTVLLPHIVVRLPPYQPVGVVHIIHEYPLIYSYRLH